MQHFVFAGKVAVVTGAAGGIGAALAVDLARRGTALALIDRDADGLARVAQDAASAGSPTVTTYVVDLSDDGDRAALAADVLDDHGSVDLLVNNAGVALGGTFEEVSEADFDWLLSINLHAVIAMTRAFLPALRARPGSHLVNISSLFGLIAPPQQVAYATSKYAVRGFTEALRNELAGSVGVTVVHPGGIRTGIATNARMASADEASNARGRDRMNALLTMPPEQAAAEIVDAVHRRRPRLVISRTAKLLDVLVRVAPAHYWAVITRISAAARRAEPHRR